MKKFLVLLLLQGPLFLFPILLGQNVLDNICKEACDELEKGNYVKARSLFEDCEDACEECVLRYRRPRQDCERKLKEQVTKSGDKMQTSSKEGDMYKMEAYDTIERVMYDTVFRTHYDTVLRRQYKTDTIFYTDNSRFVHPFFNKNLKLKKSVWYGTVNGVGGAALVGGIVCGIQAQSNYRKHKDYAADTRQDHRQYYCNYRVCNGLMWGCIGLAVAAFTSNFLAVQVSDEVRISPGVLMDMQGNVQASLSVRF